MSDKIRKYVLPNLPYLFVFWFFSKIGTAYRIAPGTDFGTKLMGMLDTFPKAFETYWPGLGGIDLLVGLAGAAGVYLLIQSKIRQAKKFRRDAEYGTARFGTKEDIKPFVDPKFQNNVILTGTEFLTMNTRPKIPANARNLNACVIGSSGSGKTRFWLTPQLLQAHSSYVVVDPKGGTLDQCGRFLQREKYRVRVFNSIDFSKSMHYNPLAYIKTESDVLKFVTALIANTKGDGKEGDEFWTKAETLLYCALVAYIVFEGPEEERNMNTLVEMINSMEVREDDETFKNAVDYMFDGLERRSPQHFAVRQYKKYKLASGHAAVVQPVHQFFHSCAIVVPLKGFYHKGSFQRVDLKELLLIHLKTNGNRAAVVLPLQNILGHAAHNFFRKFCRVVFSHAGEHTLDHDTRRAVRDRLRGRYQLDMISFQLILIVR